MSRAYHLFSYFLICVFSVTALAEPDQCKDAMKVLGDAQSKYNKAVGAWRQATVKVSQAEYELSIIEGKLKANDRKDLLSQRELDSALADQVVCQEAEKNGELSPLIDCKAVPGRIAKAKADLAACEIERTKLEGDFQKTQQELEEREEEQAAAHAAEQAARVVLDEAKAVVASCPRHG